MKSLLALTVGMLALGGVASAQTTSTAGSIGYVQVVGQSAFGGATSQSYGAEGGMRLASWLQVFVEYGWTRNVAPDSMRQAAQLIGAFLTATQGGAAFAATESNSFFDGGVRYPLPKLAGLEPYVLGGAGWAHLKKDVTFSVGGADVTGKLADLGVQLGADLAGTENAALVTVGGGLVWPAWRTLIFDFNYRYGRIFASQAGINSSRAGLGIGVRF